MDYRIIDNYLDCPYKAFLALSKRDADYNLETIFKHASEKSIQHFLSDKENLTHKIKLNKSVSIFEHHLKENNIHGATFDLLLRKFINNIKRLYDTVDYELINTVPYVTLNLDITNVEKVEMQILGYHYLKIADKESYRFFIYEPNIKHDKIDNFLRIKVLIHALRKEPSINFDLLSNSVITLLDFYNNEIKNVHIGKLVDATTIGHIESIVMSIKLGMAYPSPKPYHCDRCEYKKNCIYTCDSKADMSLNDESDAIQRKYEAFSKKI